MASLRPWSFLPMGIGEQHCGCLALVTFYLGDAFSRQRLIWATLPLGDASPRRRLMLTLTLTLTLTLSLSMPGYGTVQIHIGYAINGHAYRVYNKRLLAVEESIHIVFDETDFCVPKSVLDEPDMDDLRTILQKNQSSELDATNENFVKESVPSG